MQYRSPFEGAPRTKIITAKDGHRAFIVKARYLTPWRFKLTRFCSNTTAFVVMVTTCWWLAEHPESPDWSILVALIAPWLLWSLWFGTFRLIFSRAKRIKLSEETVEAGRFLGKVRFDRKLDHKFALLPHDSAKIEQIKHGLAIQKEAARGRAIAKLPVYGNSFHLSFDYLGQRNDLMTIYGQEEALRILTRLIACDEVLNAQFGLGEGFATRPEDDWKTGPGDLDE